MDDYVDMQGIQLSWSLGQSEKNGDNSAGDHSSSENAQDIRTSHPNVLVKESGESCVAQNEQQTVSDHEYVNIEKRNVSTDVSISYLPAIGASRNDLRGERTVPGKNYVDVELTPMNAKASIVESGASCSAKAENPLIVVTQHSEAGQAGGLYANFPPTSAEEYCETHRSRENGYPPGTASKSNSSAPSDSDQTPTAQVSEAQNASHVVNENLELSPADSSCPKASIRDTKSSIVLDRDYARLLACLLVVFALISICSGILAGIAFHKAISTDVDYPLQWQAFSLNDQHASKQQGEKNVFL